MAPTIDDDDHITSELQSLTSGWIEGSIKYMELMEFCQNNKIFINDDQILKVIYGSYICSDKDFELSANQNENLLDDEFNMNKNINCFEIVCFSRSTALFQIIQLCNKLKLSMNQKYDHNFTFAERQKMLCLLLSVMIWDVLYTVEDNYSLIYNIELILQRITSPALIASQPVREKFVHLIKWMHCRSFDYQKLSKTMLDLIFEGFEDVKNYFNLEIWEFLFKFVLNMAQNLDGELLAFEYFDKLREFPPKRVEFFLLELLEIRRNKNQNFFLLSFISQHFYFVFRCRIIHSISQNDVIINLETAEHSFNYLVGLFHKYNDKQKVQLVIETFGGLFGSLIDKYQNYLNHFLLKNIQKLSNEYAKKCHESSESHQVVDLNVHTNWCCLFLHLFANRIFKWSNNLIDLLFNYVLLRIDPVKSSPEESLETVSWVLLMLENVFIKQTSNHKSMNLFKSKLSTLVEKYTTVALNSTINSANDSTRGQVRWCSQWLLENIFKLDSSQPICDFKNRRKFYKIFSTFCVTRETNSYDLSRECYKFSFKPFFRSDLKWQNYIYRSDNVNYYEVIMITSGKMLIGWRTMQKNLNNTKAGDDIDSVEYDGYNQCIWHNSVAYQQNDIPQLQAGDVIGCLVEPETKKFTFYINGSIQLFHFSIDFPHIHFSPYPYHVSVSLSPGQQCLFKFYENAFKHSNKTDCEVYANPIKITHSTIANAIFNVGKNNHFGNVEMFCNNSLEKQFASESQSTNQTANQCNICDAELITKRLRFECCDYLKFCLKCADEYLEDCQNCAKVSIESSKTENVFCFLCQKNMVTKRLQFECCSQRKFCHNCAITLKNCPKCKC